MTFTYVTGFSNDPAAAQRSRLAMQLRADLDRLSEEAVTGRAADQPAALDGRTGTALRLENRLADLAGYRTGIDAGAARLEAQQGALNTVRDSALALFETVQSALSSGLPNALPLVAEDARLALTDITAALNLRYAGDSQFAGDATEGPALTDPNLLLTESVTIATVGGGGSAGADDLRAAFDTPGATYDTLFYLGGTGDPPGIGLDDGVVANSRLRADDPAVRGVLREIAVIATAVDPGVNPNAEIRRDILADARDRLFSALEPLSTEIGRLGVTQERIDVAATRRASEETALSIAREGLIERDRFAAASDLNAVEAALGTLFSATGRLSQLTLSSFLR